jgi:hypothetical protein
MKPGDFAIRAAVCAIFAAAALPAAAADGETVDLFTVIDDAVELKAFDSANTAADIDNPNKLIIGLHEGHNAFTGFKEFRAGTADLGNGPSFVMDTISLVITAPAEHYIAKITYSQKGTSGIGRHGRTGVGANWVVDDQPYNVGERSFGAAGIGRQDAWSLEHTVDLADQKRTSVPVSITTALYAVTTATSGSASMKLLNADVVVELGPPPEPPKPSEAEPPPDLPAVARLTVAEPPLEPEQKVDDVAAAPPAAPSAPPEQVAVEPPQQPTPPAVEPPASPPAPLVVEAQAPPPAPAAVEPPSPPPVVQPPPQQAAVPPAVIEPPPPPAEPGVQQSAPAIVIELPAPPPPAPVIVEPPAPPPPVVVEPQQQAAPAIVIELPASPPPALVVIEPPAPPPPVVVEPQQQAAPAVFIDLPPEPVAAVVVEPQQPEVVTVIEQ